MLVAQSCLTLCNPMDCNPPHSSVHGILQARILEWVAIPFSRESSRSGDWNGDTYIAGRFFTIWFIWDLECILMPICRYKHSNFLSKVNIVVFIYIYIIYIIYIFIYIIYICIYIIYIFIYIIYILYICMHIYIYIQVVIISAYVHKAL